MTTTAPEVESLTSEKIPIFIMGKKYVVPDSLTIMKAMEYAGFKFVRGAGCRGGICGACGTVYRKPGDYKIYVGLACQTLVEPEMYLTQLPFYPANRARFEWDAVQANGEAVGQLYPELFRCVACNACTKVCPMDVEVLDYISAVNRGDLEAAAEISFDCIQCGLCASRCMGEMAQYHIAQVARRLQGGKLAPKAEHLAKMVDDIEAGTFNDVLAEAKTMSEDELKKVYVEREMEPHMGDDSWAPASKHGLA